MLRPPLVGIKCPALDESCKRPSLCEVCPELCRVHVSDLPLLCRRVCTPQGRIRPGRVHRGEGCHRQDEGTRVSRSGDVLVLSGWTRSCFHRVLFPSFAPRCWEDKFSTVFTSRAKKSLFIQNRIIGSDHRNGPSFQNPGSSQLDI